MESKAFTAGEDLGQLEWRCKVCGRKGLITSVITSLTRIGLEGLCVECKVSHPAWFDLLELHNAVNELKDGEEVRAPRK